MILIVDCGSTKAEWVVLENKNVVERYITNGFNPNFNDLKLLTGIIHDCFNKVNECKSITSVSYYGSGCGNDVNASKVRSAFEEFFADAEVEVSSDILGSCRALLGNENGIACILGTGSNACLYDGKNIVKNAVSLGYVLGDEGSGCHIGKQIVHDYFYYTMPNDLRQKFSDEFKLTRDALIESVYKSPQPSRFLASFTKFAAGNIDNQYIANLVSKSFNEFIDYCICPLTKEDNGETVGFVGSVAYYFKDVLKQCLENHHFNVGKIIKSPMDGLIRFYS